MSIPFVPAVDNACRLVIAHKKLQLDGHNRKPPRRFFMKVWQPCRTCLEARSASAQADYDLQAAIGATEIAHGDLATALGISPTSQFRVESIQHLNIPQDLTDSISPQSLYAISTPAPISS